MLQDACSPKLLCALVFLFRNGLIFECFVVIGCHFSTDSSQLCETVLGEPGDVCNTCRLIMVLYIELC